MAGLSDFVSGLEGWRRLALAVVCGVVLALAQPPVSWAVAVIPALVVSLWLCDGARTARAGFFIGLFMGTGYFASSLSWIIEPFQIDPEVYGWMAPFALVGLSAGLALFWGLAFMLAAWLWSAHPLRIFLLAGFWALSEFLRSTILTGFPWGLIAYSWVETPVIQTVSIIGPHGLGFITLVAGLAMGLATFRSVVSAGLILALAWGFGAWALSQPVPERAEPLLVRIVQPNAAQHLKWDPAYQQEFFRRLIDNTGAGEGTRPDVVIWPETAIASILGENPAIENQITAAAGPDTTLILGIRRREPAPGGVSWFNSMAVFGSAGQILATYDKHHLVPFGEYLPFGDLVRNMGITGLTGQGFSAGDVPDLVSVNGVPSFRPLICYEAIFPGQISVPVKRAEWLVQVTNDAWFGDRAGPAQHFAQARVRAIEQGLPLARSANTGISAMIDARGRIVARIESGQEGYIDADLPEKLTATLYSRAGDFWVLLVIISILMLTLVKLKTGVSERYIQ